MRAIRARYDPYEQSRGRVEQLRSLGHSVDKVEFICMGGTFLSLPESYRSNFMAQLHNSLSGYTGTDLDEAVKSVLYRPERPAVEMATDAAMALPDSQPQQRQNVLVSPSRHDQITACSRI